MGRIGIVVKLQNVKTVKNACEKAAVFDRFGGIKKLDQNLAIITTKLGIENYDDQQEIEGQQQQKECKQRFINKIDFELSEDYIEKVVFLEDNQNSSSSSSSTSQLAIALSKITPEPENKLLFQQCLSNLPRYELYHDFILFQNTMDQEPWTTLIHKYPEYLNHVSKLFKVNHLAVKVSIPRQDIVRRPIIKPIFGDFGDYKNVESPPNRNNLDSVFWASATLPSPKPGRSDIKYVWSPMFTMYSRGNTSEKHRVALFEDVKDCNVVDLYAGIGYFVIPYLSAGAKRIFACELNPWSIEGLKRGVKQNGFTSQLVQQDQLSSFDISSSSSSQVIIFPYSNELAAKTLQDARARHVNLGLLPHARLGIPIAVNSLHENGGWLHVHEEVVIQGGGKSARQEPKQIWGKEIAEMVRKLALQRWSDPTLSIQVETKWVEEVKSLGKELWHLVADVWVQVD